MIRCLTLFDITRNGDYYAQNQLKNWHTLVQAIGLKSIPTIQAYPTRVYRKIDDIGFGENYTGFHNVWLFDFDSDNFKNNLESLENEIGFIPMITGLEESVEDLKKYTIVSGENKNICFLLL